MEIKNTLRKNSQNWRLLEALFLGPVYTQSRYSDSKLMFGYLSARIRDINERCLNPQGYEIVKEAAGVNNWKYEIAKMERKAA